MEVDQIIRAARRLSGLTQTQAAGRAHTSQATLARYETGQKSPRIDTLERLAKAMGGQLQLDISLPALQEVAERPLHLLRREERRSLWLHRAIAAKIQADPSEAMALARANLTKLRSTGGWNHSRRWQADWLTLLDGPLEELLVRVCSTSIHASQLRQTTPFAGLLTPQERWAAYRSFGAVDEARAA